jgi:hypothetical protein
LDGVLEFTEPNITLLRSRGIEDPSIVVANEFMESRRVAMELTKHVPFFVFALEVPYVDGKTNMVKVVITRCDKMLHQRAIVVVEDIRGDRTQIQWRKCCFEKCLEDSQEGCEFRRS